MRTLLFLIPLIGFAQTDLPGPVGALPEPDHSLSYGVCGWNKTQTKEACLTVQDTLAALTGNAVFGPTNTYWQFDRKLQVLGIDPVSNLGSDVGTTALNYDFVFSREFANYSAGVMAIYSDVGAGGIGIALDTGNASSIQLYTNNTLRAQVLAGGAFEVENLGGSGNRCPRVNNSGDFSLTGRDCLDPTVSNTFTATQTFNAGPSIIVSVIKPTAPTVTSTIGDTTDEFLDLHVQDIYNYGPNPMAMYSDTQLMTFDIGAAGQAIQFYTHNIIRGGFDDNGFVDFSLGGGGTQCVETDNVGRLSAFTCPLGGVTAVTGTSPIVSSGGSTPAISCPTCGVANSNTGATCNSLNTLTGTYATTTCNFTVPTTGTWYISSTIELIVTGTASSAVFAAFINGSLPSSTDIAALANVTSSSSTLAASLTHTWIYTLNSGDTIDIRAASSAGASNQSSFGNVMAVYLHP